MQIRITSTKLKVNPIQYNFSGSGTEPPSKPYKPNKKPKKPKKKTVRLQ